jgi:prepilin-type processing-associated H-X9-DG protein/prepilin-type N-terminal cleavage/methylation domain-containing protein
MDMERTKLPSGSARVARACALAPTHLPPSARLRRAFTLVELLVVIGVIALLIAILLPSLSRARDSAKGVACLSNLRQMATAAQAYANEFGGSYPIAYYSATDTQFDYAYNWDFTLIKNRATGERSVRPGLLWAGEGNMQIQQCPTFDGRSMTLMDPFTGYNYNTSYIGHGDLEQIVAPAKTSQVRNPAATALFGDGQWSSGANKFMRSPNGSPSDSNLSARHAGTQGYRHNKRTNVAFADGHAEALLDRFTAGRPVGQGTGFLSEDNALYDLE